MDLTKEDKDYLLSSVREVKDYPKKGIVFKDITTLLSNAKALGFLMDYLYNRYKDYNIDYIVGIESRGFIFGSILAKALNLGFVPIRKKGKLPFTTISQKYSLEYGFDEIEIHIDAFKKGSRVLLIDDLIATGGTALAACKLLDKMQAELVEACFLIHLSFLDGFKNLSQNYKAYSLLEV